MKKERPQNAFLINFISQSTDHLFNRVLQWNRRIIRLFFFFLNQKNSNFVHYNFLDWVRIPVFFLVVLLFFF
jgi:hypothetical protein